MIASHNSWTFLSPARWWMWLIAPFSKCQNKTILEQVEAGCVMVDLRLKYYNGRMRVAHGGYVCDYTINDVFLDLHQARPEYCRVFLESRYPTGEEIDCFRAQCKLLETMMPAVKFVGGHGAHEPNWSEQYYEFKNKEPYYSEKHASVCGGICPWLWAKRHNDEISTEGITMIDYV